MKNLTEYLGSVEHLAHLGRNYAENELPREVPTQYQGANDDAFYAAYDGYVWPTNWAMVPMFGTDEALEAMQGVAFTAVDMYVSWCIADADETTDNGMGDGVALIEMTTQDLCILAALHTWDIEGDECDVEPWREVKWCVAGWDDRGFTYPMFYDDESAARRQYDACAMEYDNDEENN